jgi:hypothetical protein
VHPADVVAELAAVGFEPLRRTFFEIDPFNLDPDRTVIFVNRRASIEDPLDASQWMPFRPAAIAEMSEFNDASRR